MSTHQNKRVHFQEQCTVRFVEKIDVELALATWYQKEDFKKFRRERKRVLCMIQTVGMEQAKKSGDFIFQGIEHLVDEETRDRQYDRIYDAWYIVFHE